MPQRNRPQSWLLPPCLLERNSILGIIYPREVSKRVFDVVENEGGHLWVSADIFGGGGRGGGGITKGWY